MDRRSHPARSALFVMVATLGSALLGFVRELVNAASFGTSGEMDAFLAASIVPMILFGVFNGALVNALVPIFSDYVATDREDDAWRLASTLILTIAGGLSAAAALVAYFAPVYIPWIARFHDARLELAVAMARVLMPTIIASSLAGIVAALLNSYQRFRAAALQGLVANLCIVGGVVVFCPRFGIGALVIATLVGAFAQLAVQLPAFFALRRFRWVFDFQHVGMRRLLVVLGPIAVGSAAGQIGLFFDRFFASALAPGSISGMNYALKLAGFPQQIVINAIATVVFPLFAGQFATKNLTKLRASFVATIKAVFFLTIPMIVGLGVLAHPIVQTLFQRGAFGPADSDLCAGMLPFAAAGLLGIAANAIMTRCLYASGNVRGPITVSLLTMGINVGLSVLFLPALAARGLLLANAVSQTCEAVVLTALVWKLLGGVDVRALVTSLGKVVISSTAMGAVLVGIPRVQLGGVGGSAQAALALAISAGTGVAVFMLVEWMIDAAQLKAVVAQILRRGSRLPEAMG